MTQSAMNNAIVLYQLSVTREWVEAAERTYICAPLLKEVLEDPTISPVRKKNIISNIFRLDEFPIELVHFIEYMCSHGEIGELEECFKAFYAHWDKKNNILRAELVCAKEPREEEVAETERFIEQRYPGKKVMLKVKKDPDILGGAVIRVGYEEYDASYEGRLRQLERKLIGR